MPDISHLYGNDLTVDATGDIATSEGSQLGQERVIRRLLTSPSDYLWHATYGAGLARFIGQPVAGHRIGAVTRSQMFKETAVQRNPAPVITVQVDPGGTVTESIKYVDADTGSTVTLTLPIGPE